MAQSRPVKEGSNHEGGLQKRKGQDEEWVNPGTLTSLLSSELWSWDIPLECDPGLALAPGWS